METEIPTDPAPAVIVTGNSAAADPEVSISGNKVEASPAGSLSADVDSVPLVAEGGVSAATEWAYDETRKLNISADFTGVTGDRILKVEMPVGMVFNAGGYPTDATDPQTISGFSYVQCDLPKGFSSNETGGTLTYSINPAVDRVSLQILISYDEKLWNKINGGPVTGSPGDSDYMVPVKVTITAGDTAETVILSEVTTATSTGNRYYTAYSADPSLTSAKTMDEPVFVGRHFIYNGRDGGKINGTPAKYWTKLTLIQEAPYVLRDGKKIYAAYVKSADIAPSGYTITNYEDTHKTEVVWENCGLFSYSAPQINACYTFSKSAGFQAGDTVIYPQPVIRAQGIYGEEYDYYRAGDENGYIKFLLGDSEELSLTVGGSKNFLTGIDNTDIVFQIADFKLSNMGAKKTGNKRFTYTFESTSGVGVTTLRLIMPKKEDCILTENGKVEILYTVVDEDGNAVAEDIYKGRQELSPHPSDNTGGSIILSRDDSMIEKHYYFHTITYVVGALQPGTLYYTNSSPFLSGGTVHVKRTESGSHKPSAGGVCLTASLVIASTAADGTNSVSQEISIKAADEVPVTTMGFRNNPLEANTSIPAGGTLTVDAKLEASNYPDHTIMYVTKPVFYLRLPKELSLVDGSLKTDRDDVSPVQQNPFPEKDAAGRDTGYTLTPVTFNEEVPFGYFNEKLEAIGGRPSITLTFTLQASKDTSSITPYDLRDLVCAGAEDAALNKENSGWNPYNWTHNPTAEDRYSKGLFRVTYSHDPAINTAFTVQAAAPMIDFSAEIKKHEGTTDADYGTEITLIDNKGSFDYRIQFRNNKGGTVDGSKFYYLIQLPKNGATLSDHVSDSGELPSFDFSLTGPVKLKSQYQDLYDVGYSCDTPADPSNAGYYNNGRADFEPDGKTYATFYSESQIASDSGWKWENVRCIKITVKKDAEQRVIPDGEECTLTLENVMWELSGTSGNTVFHWSACGLQRYDLEKQASEGHTPTNPVSIRIHPFEITSAATLTGVRDGNPSKGTAKTVEIPIPAYNNAKTLKIKSVKVVSGNINLVSSAEMDKNRSGSDLWGDTHFTLTAGLDSGQPVDLLDTNIGTQIGITPEKTVSKLILTLDHANLMSTNSNVGDVEVVIGDDNGIVITEIITIRTIGTEMNPADLTGAVIQGKRYNEIGVGSTQVAITSDSSVSAQFNIQNYLYSSYGEPYIRAGEGSFPAGSTLVMADITDSKAPQYYYYNCGNSTGTIKLSEFVNMKDGVSAFSRTDLPVDAGLLFVLDYAQANLNVPEKQTQKLELIFPSGDGGSTSERSQSVQWQITKKRDFVINITGGSAITMTDDGMTTLSGYLSSNILSGNDTYHYSDYLTLSLSLYDGTSGKAVDFPPGTTITANGITSGTAENKALLSLGNARADDKIPFVIQLQTAGWVLAPGSYKLKAELYCSRAEGYISAVSTRPETEVAITLTVVADPDCGLSVKQTDSIGRLIEPGASLEFQLDYKAGTDVQFSAMLYAKTEGSYSGTVTAWGTQPEFSTVGETCTAVIMIPETVNRGSTYRIVFCMESGGKVIEVPYNIIILEEGGRQAD